MKVNSAAEPLYIVKPFSGGGVASLFSTHPPIEERVRRLRAMALGVGQGLWTGVLAELRQHKGADGGGVERRRRSLFCERLRRAFGACREARPPGVLGLAYRY